MSTTCVIGTQWGDEGKGRVVDLLADKADLVVRYQGGSNAGHTVIFGGETYRLHLVPSGILRPGKTCVIAHGVVFDPTFAIREIDELAERGRIVGDDLVISDRAHVVMPWHRRLDQARERAAGKQAHGTTGRGISFCYADKVSYRGIRVGDLYQPQWFRERLDLNVREKNRLLEGVYGEEPLDAQAIYDEYLAYAERLRPYIGDAVTLLHDAVAGGRDVLFEGGQGVLLDVDLGSYPFVTGSNSCALGVPSGTGVSPRALTNVIGVSKAYCTRVGAGPFMTEDHGPDGDRLRDVGREFGTTTGRPRRCGWFDAVTNKYAVRSNGIDTLAVTKLDVLQGMPTLKMCIAYDTPEGRITHVPSTAVGLEQAKPVYREYPGFDEDVSGARKLEDLPDNARRFLDAISEESDAPISLVSVGPSREQVIRLDGAA